ncbi:hypothetical protein [Enterobacter mori]
MKPFYVLVLFFTSALCFAETVTIDPTSTTKADDSNTIANMYRMGMGVPKDMKKALNSIRLLLNWEIRMLRSI